MERQTMRIFSSILDLQNEIRIDKCSRDPYVNRYPVRLIFLPSLQILKNIVKLFDDAGIEVINLANFLPSDDGWLSVKDLIDPIKKFDKNNDFIIVPFSEVIRFFDKNNFNDLFNALSSLENDRENPFRRLYIPLVGIYERFKNEFYENFYRKENWAPIWQVNIAIPTRIKIFITDMNIKNLPALEIVHNTKDWLELWKKDNIEKIICISHTLTYLYPNRLPDSVFDIETIKNFKEWLSKIYDINLPMEFKDAEVPFWNELSNMFIEKGFRDLEDAIRKVFNVVNIELKDIIKLWLSSNRTLDRWLLKNYVCQKQEWNNTYIYIILNSLDALDGNELEENIWFKIFELPNKSLYCNERMTLLKHVYAAKEVPAYIESKLLDEFKRITNFKEKKKLLTGIASCEKKLAIELFANDKIEVQDLIEAYPDLHYYLSDVFPENINKDISWIRDYFKEYRLSKLKDKISDELNTILNEKNKNKEQFYHWYYNFETASQILGRENVDKILLIDALGIEWLPFLCNFIEHDLNLHIGKKYIARAYLPTTTGCNRLDSAIHIYDFDKVVHSSEQYRYPEDIVKEIDFIKRILFKYLSIPGQERVAIASDHGLTALARLKENIKIYNFQNTHHEGRCMWINNNDILEDNDFIIHNIENPCCGQYSKCLISLKYTSLDRRPLREVHGGATPEEVLIPVIIISKQHHHYQQDFEISFDRTRISKREHFIWMAINPNPDILPILTDQLDRPLSIEYDKDFCKWRVNIRELKTGKQIIKIKIGSWEKTFNIELVGGMRETDIL